MTDSASILGFNGEAFDPVSGTYHLGNGYRTYSPVLRQFLAPDSMSPFGAGGINPYSYCAGDPINHSDPSGHFHISFMSILGVAGVIGGLAAAPFTGGSSLALAAALGGAVLGAVSAGTAIAAENTTGSAHNTLAKISLGTGIAGGILDAASLAGPALARNVGRMGSTGLLSIERESAGVAEEGKVFTTGTFVHEGQAAPRANGMAKRITEAEELDAPGEPGPGNYSTNRRSSSASSSISQKAPSVEGDGHELQPGPSWFDSRSPSPLPVSPTRQEFERITRVMARDGLDTDGSEILDFRQIGGGEEGDIQISRNDISRLHSISRERYLRTRMLRNQTLRIGGRSLPPELTRSVVNRPGQPLAIWRPDMGPEALARQLYNIPDDWRVEFI